MLIAQITDLHIRRRGKLLHHMIDTAKYLRRCVERLNELDPLPDVVLATGDLVESGKPKEYERLREILEPLRIPLFVVPGNHDDRAHFCAAFADGGYLPKDGRPVHYTVENFPLRLIGLDSTEKGLVGGMLDTDRIGWLSARLHEQPARPTLLFMHHPPFATGIRAVDRMGFFGLHDLETVVGRHPQIERILGGHIHREMRVDFANTIATTAPSTAHQLVLEPDGKKKLGFTLESPGFTLHRWIPGAGILSTTMTIGRTSAPYRFDERGRVKIR